jgi:hypothetical protein
MAVIPEAIVDLRTHQGAERLRDVADRFEQVHRALRVVAERPERTVEGADLTAWAEDTLLAMGEISEWLAEAWERVLVAVESVAGEEGVASTLVPRPSFVDAMIKGSSRTTAA